MADVIREAEIIIRYRTDKSKLETPELSQAVRAQEQVTEAVKKTVEAERAVASSAAAASESIVTRTRSAANAQREYTSAIEHSAAAERARAAGLRRNFDQEEEYYRKRTAAAIGVKPKDVTHDQVNTWLRAQNMGYQATIRDNRRDDAEATKQADEATKKYVATMDNAGRTTKRASIEGLEGVMQLSRGVALLAANGSEDMQKLLQSIVAVEGGISLVKGLVNIGRLQPEIAIVTAAVAAGAASWLLYSQQVERAKSQMEAVNAEHRKAVQLQNELQHIQAEVGRRGQASRTDSEIGDAKRREVESRELEDIRKRIGESQGQLSSADARRKRAKQLAEKDEAEALTLPENAMQAALQGFTRPSDAGRAIGYRNQLVERAKKLRDDEKFFGEEAIAAQQAALGDAERQRELLDRKRQAELGDIERSKNAQLEAMRRADDASSPMEKAMRELEKIRFDQNKQAIIPGLQQFGLPGVAGVLQGTSFQDSREEPIHQQAKQAAERIIKETRDTMNAAVDVITQFKTELERLKKDLAAGGTR